MKTLLFCLISLFGLSSTSRADDHLKPFLTDYCTSYPEGTREQPNLWKHCCIQHDLYFWAGGSLEERKATDLQLKACVEATGQHLQAQLIYIAVSSGARSPIRFKAKEWGNAWTNRARYQALSSQEKHEVIMNLESLDHADLSTELKQSFIEHLNLRLEAP